MKEATGELNMTVVTVVAIAAIAAFFYALIWPQLKTQMQLNSACSAASGTNYSSNGITCNVQSDGSTVCNLGDASKTCKTSE